VVTIAPEIRRLRPDRVLASRADYIAAG